MIYQIDSGKEKTGTHIHPLWRPTEISGTFLLDRSCLYEPNHPNDLHQHNVLCGIAQYHRNYQSAYLAWNRTELNYGDRIRLIAAGIFQGTARALHIVNIKANIYYHFHIKQVQFVSSNGRKFYEGFQFYLYDTQGNEWGDTFISGVTVSALFGYLIYPQWRVTEGAPHPVRVTWL